MKKSIGKWLIRVIAIDAGIALAVPLFQSFFDPHATLHVLLRQYFYSIVYANLIGIPISILLPLVWIRSADQLPRVRLGLRAGLILLCNFFGCAVAGLVLRILIGPQYVYWQEFSGSFGLSLVLSAVVVAFVSMYEAQQAKVKATALALKNHQLERERVLKLASEARLSSLESRIHPHFLFNTINSVSALIHEDPLRAEKMLGQLAELLRFSLDAAPGGLVSLERELQIVGDYLDIEKMRFGPRLSFEILIAPELLMVQVPPFCLQTLVENSIKYAVGPRARGAVIRVWGTAEDGSLKLQVRDNGPGFAETMMPQGHGLHNLEERLIALFGEMAKLQVRTSEAGTTVAFEVPAHGVLNTDISESRGVAQPQ